MAIGNRGLVTIFGGSGFVGTYVVRALVKDGWRVRVATRSPHTQGELRVIGGVGQVQLVQANVRFKSSVERALEGADAVINLVSVLYQSGRQSFEALNVMGARNIAQASAARGITNYVHVSALGADVESKSDYTRTKGEGEIAVREAMPSAAIVRPSIIFGPEDGFFNKFAAMAQISPALPLLGGGETKFQPVYVGDVADAIATIIGQKSAGKTFALGGPRVYSFKELLQFILTHIHRKRLLLPVPWPIAGMMGMAGEFSGYLPFVAPFLTRDQVEDLKADNLVDENVDGLAELGISPESIEAIVPPYLERYRKYGQFFKTA